MSSIGSLTSASSDLRSPDVRERDEAARVIWDHFEARLHSLVRRHLDNRIRRREDEQDILQSMYASFCIGQLEGNDPPASRQELWKLLVRITLVQGRQHGQPPSRGPPRRPPRAALGGPAATARTLFPLWMLDHVDRRRPAPTSRLIVLEELDRLLHGLPEELRQIVLWKLDGYTNAEISAHARPHRPLRRAQDAVDPQAAGLESVKRDQGADEDRRRRRLNRPEAARSAPSEASLRSRPIDAGRPDRAGSRARTRRPRSRHSSRPRRPGRTVGIAGPQAHGARPIAVAARYMA